MDQTQLMIELSRIQGARFLSVTSATETRMNKTNGKRKAAEKRLNPFHGRVLSVRNSTYQPCYDYGAAVERARAKSETYDGPTEFEVGESWHERVMDANGKPTAFVRHPETERLYFYGRELVKGKTTYIAAEDIPALGDDNLPTGALLYRAGDEIAYDDLSPWMPEYKPSAKQGLSEDEEIKPRTLKIESIRGLKRDGVRKAVAVPIARAEPEAVTRVMAAALSDMPDIDLSTIPERYRNTPAA
tara:strand:- start:13750 stop:14481 length:732 start_codon:yes stop_codon:yes gene_type:complete